MATFRRLLGFLRPYRAGLLASGALAAVAMVMTALIPYLTGRAIDQMREGDRSGLHTLPLALLAPRGLRLALTVVRRLLAGRVSLGVELDLRQRMYAHLQSLELAFFDRQQTGQLMSRATVDLQSVRFFLGYGLIFMLQSALTILFASVAMFATSPGLAAISLAPVPFVVGIAARYGRRSRPALQEVQQRIAELTADVEENVGGVRVVKAFAREQRQLERFRTQVGRVFDQAMVSTRLQAFYNPFIGFLPQVGLAAILFVGGRQVIRGDLTVGQFSAFYAYLLMLLSPMRTLGISLGLAQRATASGARIYQILDRAPQITPPPRRRPRARPPPRRCRRATAASSCAASRSSTRAPGAPRCATSRSTSRPALPSRSSARPARARRRSSSSCRGSTTSTRARCSWTARTCARSTSAPCGARSRSSTTTRSCSPRPSPTTSPTRMPTPAASTRSPPPAARRPTTSSCGCPTATTRASASAG